MANTAAEITTPYPGAAPKLQDLAQTPPPFTRPRPTYADAVAEDDAFFEKLLGDGAYFFIPEFLRLTRLSHTTLYRAMDSGAIPYITIGHRRAMTRAFTLGVLRHGLRPFSNQGGRVK